jgi:hypothetical protein
VVFVVQDGLIGADTDIEVAKLRSLPEKLNMSAMQEVVAARDKYFLGHKTINLGQNYANI